MAQGRHPFKSAGDFIRSTSGFDSDSATAQERIRELEAEVEQMHVAMEDMQVRLDECEAARAQAEHDLALGRTDARERERSADTLRQVALDNARLRHLITEQKLISSSSEEELRAAFEELQVLTEELEAANASLRANNETLEQVVAERTTKLTEANEALQRANLSLSKRARRESVARHRIQAHLEEQRRLERLHEVLIAELQHRTRNLIGVIQSVATSTLASSRSMQAFGSAFRERLSALSRIQGLLSRDDEDPITIREVVEMELSALGEDSRSHATIEGPTVSLPRAALQTFALGVHELATNAQKHGALSQRGGGLRVTWRLDGGLQGDSWLRLEWREDCGRRANLDKPGYGSELFRKALPYALGAITRLDPTDTGLRCTIDMPLNETHKTRTT